MRRTKSININIIFLIGVVFLFAIIILKLSYVSLSKKVDGIDLGSFADSRDTVEETIIAKRGTIYDANGETLAQNVNSYTVVAYLSSSRTKDPSNPHHVVDKETTAKALAPIINMTEEKILKLLNYDAYQVELGPGGRGLTELVKEEIEALNLPGIGFISSTKRYYPNADFLSYTLGYAKTDEAGNIIGEFGTELYLNKELTGKNGYTKYQADMYGYQIANTTPIVQKAESGNDVYLTIDTNIQMFTEQAISSLEDVGIEWGSVSIVNAKTGEILGVASSPSFNPNIKNIKSYYDPFVSYTFEPGSTMKIFSFMAAIENGVFNPNESYNSGTIKIDDVTIKDWNNKGWGKITFSEGFMVSSNVAASIISQKLGRDKLHDFYKSIGLGQKVGLSLPNEQSGSNKFVYNTEVATASFGQGISITPVQMIQALSALANEGTMIKPYITKKIVNPISNKIVFEGKKEEVSTIATSETIEQIKDLMRGVVDGKYKEATGKNYYIEGYDIIGKTGTAQIVSSKGGYLRGKTDYVRSFAGLFPGDDPQIIVYMVASKLKKSSALPTVTKALIKNVATYLNIYDSKEVQISNYTVKSYVNKNITDAVSELEKNNINPIIIGDGNKIVNQYPLEGITIIKNERLFLVTNGTNYVYPNFKGWSRSDLVNYSNLLDLSISMNGYGFVTSSNVSQNAKIDKSITIEFTLEPKY